jgi:LysR family transcriptional regulator, transcription activator of glutamate synthase operon
MDINYLREFLTLAEAGNFMEAADILYTTQSSLSKHIKVLEKEFGVILFNRTTRKVKLSKYGEILLPYARQVVETLDEFNLEANTKKTHARDILNVGSLHAVAQYNIADILTDFRDKHPQSTVNLIQASAEALKEMLRQKKCELAFIRSIGNIDDDLIRIPYLIDTMAAVLPAGHPLAGEKTIPLRKLENENLLFQELLSKVCEDACLQSGFTPKVALTDIRFDNLIAMVIKGMGVALILKPLVYFLASPKIAVVNITPSISTRVDLCHLKGSELSNAAREFIACTEIQKAKNQLSWASLLK